METKTHLLTLREAAAVLGAHPNSLKNWVRDGLLTERRDEFNWLRFDLEEILQFQKERHNCQQTARRVGLELFRTIRRVKVAGQEMGENQ